MVHFLQDILKKQAKGGCAAGFPPTYPLGRAGYPPLQRPEIFAAVIRWHRPCRGGYQPPANVANF